MTKNSEIGTALCIINKIQTTIDGGARLTLDLSSESRDLIANLLDLKLAGNELVVAAFVECEQ